jgi:hypothetical protein
MRSKPLASCKPDLTVGYCGQVWFVSRYMLLSSRYLVLGFALLQRATRPRYEGIKAQVSNRRGHRKSF